MADENVLIKCFPQNEKPHYIKSSIDHHFDQVDMGSLELLVKLKSSTLAVASLEDAKKFKIGIQNEDVAGVYLKDHGFTHLVDRRRRATREPI